VNLERKNIQDGTDSCLDNGAGILTLRSSEEETFLREELEKDNLNNIFYWLGMELNFLSATIPLRIFFSRFLRR